MATVPTTRQYFVPEIGMVNERSTRQYFSGDVEINTTSVSALDIVHDSGGSIPEGAIKKYRKNLQEQANARTRFEESKLPQKKIAKTKVTQNKVVNELAITYNELEDLDILLLMSW